MNDSLEILTGRGLEPDVIDARGYARYCSAADVIAVDPRMGSEESIGKRRRGGDRSLAKWTRHYGARGPGWVMPKHKLPGSAFDDPLPQLRPDAPIPDPLKAYEHDHELDYAGRPIERTRHEAREHVDPQTGEITVRSGVHRHVPEAKYLLPPGAHGKRWDANPVCADRFASAERVFLQLEGCIKADALASKGEAAADVPSVTLWDRAGAISWADWPGGKPTRRKVQTKGSFWDGWPELERAFDEWDAEMEVVRKLQENELVRFLRAHVRAPVVVVCDSDWHRNPAVATEAFLLRDAVRRETALPCVVAAPPSADDSSKQGTDDFIARGGAVEDHELIEPRESPAFAAFARDYARAQRNGGRVSRPRIERDLELLQWYATHAVAGEPGQEGQIARKDRAIARRLGVSTDTVRRATLRLRKAGALNIEGYYHDPDAEHERDHELRSRRRPKVPTLAIAEHLRPQVESVRLREWLRRPT